MAQAEAKLLTLSRTPGGVNLYEQQKRDIPMKVSLEQTSANRIAGYDPGEIRIQRQPVSTAGEEQVAAQLMTYTQSVIVTPTRIIEDWPPQQVIDLTAGDLQPILAEAPEVLLLGTGPQLEFADPALLHPLYEAGIGVETMDSGAACRTYNILIAEGRRVMAALFVP